MANTYIFRFWKSSFFPELSALLACGLVLFYSPLVFSESRDLEFTHDEKKAIEEIIRDYIMKSPEAILRSIQEYQSRQEVAKEQQLVKVIRDRQAELLNDPNSFVAGNPDGDLTIVEFFDYQCGYCKRVHSVVKKLLQDDGNIRLVYKEFPILGPASVYAAEAAMTTGSNEKYLPFHDALMNSRGQLTEERILSIAASAGLDSMALKDEIAESKTQNQAVITKNYDLAEALNISGTPAFVIGETVIRGAVDMSTFVEVIAAARKNNGATRR